MSADDIQLVPYDPRWPEMFHAEAERLRQLRGTAVAPGVSQLGDRPDEARRYEQLKSRLASAHPRDRQAYTEGKGEHVNRITAEALSRAGPSSEA